VVSPGWFQPTHMPFPLSTTSVPTPSKHSHPVTTITRKNTTQCPEVVSTHTYAVPLSAISNTTPNSCQSHKRFMVEVVEEKRRFMNDPTHLGFNRSNRGQSGTDTPPSHTLGSIPSEHGAFALGKAAQSCATHGEANRWGSRIYGDTVSTIQNPNRYRLHSLHTHRELCVCEVVNSQQGGVGVTLCLQ
jgi:hypothetical protein